MDAERLARGDGAGKFCKVGAAIVMAFVILDVVVVVAVVVVVEHEVDSGGMIVVVILVRLEAILPLINCCKLIGRAALIRAKSGKCKSLAKCSTFSTK